ncbi:MAG: polymer-forming cytoskeletal protein [Gemmatimonadota bacterium]|nr:polymer-forming cytoskeletal protein [Gemmatimonadota bacterium]
MARDQRNEAPARELSDVVSVIGPGMEIVGDIKCDGTVRIEGKVKGAIRATKSVVVGQGGQVSGDIETQDVVVAGTVDGTVAGASRVELQETCKVQGDIRSRRIKLDEGGRVEGRLHMGSDAGSGGSSKAGKADIQTELSGRGPSLSAAGQK